MYELYVPYACPVPLLVSGWVNTMQFVFANGVRTEAKYP